ncbi:TPA: hypothetical protein P0E04_004098 [Vibrio campbellii]|nr:hypothetical protein DZA51_00740 [Vibrio campbellii]HDM8045849.1 hypothetical protein [Vibrio campbellii]
MRKANTNNHYASRDCVFHWVTSSKPPTKYMKASVTPLAQFDSKGMVVLKRVKGRNFSYECEHLFKEIQDKLDSAIAKVWEEK